jgi:hypothetical protein
MAEEALRSQVRRLNTSSAYFKQQAVVGLFHLIRHSASTVRRDAILEAVAACLASRSDVRLQRGSARRSRPRHPWCHPQGSRRLQVAVEEAAVQLVQLVQAAGELAAQGPWGSWAPGAAACPAPRRSGGAQGDQLRTPPRRRPGRKGRGNAAAGRAVLRQ